MKFIFYKPAIFLITKYKRIKTNIKNITKVIRNFLILNKFLKGVRITKIEPAKLLMKNRG
jgi:hypothetical protein